MLEAVHMVQGSPEKGGSLQKVFVDLPDLLLDRWDQVLAVHPFPSDAWRRIVTDFTSAHTEEICLGSLPTEMMAEEGYSWEIAVLVG